MQIPLLNAEPLKIIFQNKATYIIIFTFTPIFQNKAIHYNELTLFTFTHKHIIIILLH